jgi:hypothetical protein
MFFYHSLLLKIVFFHTNAIFFNIKVNIFFLIDLMFYNIIIFFFKLNKYFLKSKIYFNILFLVLYFFLSILTFINGGRRKEF